MSQDSNDPNIDPNSQQNTVTEQATIADSDEILLPRSVDGKDRFISIEKISSETISPLIKRDLSVESIIEVIDRQFSYPLTAHVGLKFDSRTFPSVPKREFDVKMKLIKVPSNYFPVGGNGLDRRYIYNNPNYDGNPANLDVVFIVDQNLTYANRQLIKRNLKEMLGKLVSGYTYIRASIWQTHATASTIINEQTGDTIDNFTYYDTNEFFEVETPDSSETDQTNLFKKLNDALGSTQLSPAVNPKETVIANFFLRKSQFSLTDQSGSSPQSAVLKTIWKNTVRKVIYFSGSTPETMAASTYSALLSHANAAGIQFYYLNTDTDFSGTRTLRELAVATGGAKFNLLHNSDIKLQRFFDANFADSNKIYYGDWDGTFKLAWTDNPAWVLYDIVTDFNYGLGNHIDSTAVDKWTLYDIGRYCDAVDDDGRFRGVPDGKGGLEPRYTCNMLFSTKDEAYKVLKDVTAIFKGITYWNTEGFSFFADKPKKPIMFFGNSNVKDGQFTYTETAKNLRYTSVEVVYNDKYDFYKTKVEYIEDVDGIKKYGLNPFKINAAGCTSRSEARRIGRYVLFSSIFEADTVTFTAGLEAAYLQPGDVFGVSDEVRNVAKTFGRILENNYAYNEIRIDNEFASGLDSGIYIHIPSGGYSVSDLNAMTGSDGSFTGTLENIRARRQNQVRKFNISSHFDESYGATLQLTGDFLLKSVIYDLHVEDNRMWNGTRFTGESVLTGIVYNFPEETVVAGNPKWDSIKFSGVSGVLSNLGIDFNVSGTAGTGQLISQSALAWEITISGSPADNYMYWREPYTYTFDEFTVPGTAVLNNYTSYGLFSNQSAIGDINSIWTDSTYTNAATGSVLVAIWPKNTLTSATPNSTWSSLGATEAFNIMKDVSGANYYSGMYCAAFIKGGSRVFERASKNNNDYFNMKFTYRDLLAQSKLKPYYTFMQADVGNRFDINYGTFELGRAYYIGNVVNYDNKTYTCIAEVSKSTVYPSSDTNHWKQGNSLGYSTIGFPKDFYGTEKVYLGTTLTSTHVSNAFKSLGVDVYVGNGTLGESDLRTLDPASGIGYSGLVYGTGYEKGIYSLIVDTTPKNLELINPGSLYVLSGSGVEPKLYKTIGVKEEEANSYGVVGIEYTANKEDFIENDMMNTSPNSYVQSVFDVVMKPDAPSAIATTGVNGSVVIAGVSQPTGLYFTWNATTTSPINGYQVYVSKPDYSADVNGAITQNYHVASGVTALTIPINQNWGQYDIAVYSQGISPYKLLSSDYAATGVQVLPNPSISGAGHLLRTTLVSGVYIETADTDSLKYSFNYTSGAILGNGQGNFTSKDLVLRWEYIDPTGGIINSVESMRKNPFMKFIPDVKVSLTDIAGNVLNKDEKYQGFSYKVAIEQNSALVDRSTVNYNDVNNSRNFGFKIEVTDPLERTSTGLYSAYNIPPAFSTVNVVDGYQDSPYYIISGLYGNSSFQRLAVWNSGSDFVVTGSGVRNTGGYLIRSETTELTYEDIVQAFKSAVGIVPGGSNQNGININKQGGGSDPDYEEYVNSYGDLLDAYTKESEISKESKDVWGKRHYDTYGYNEDRNIRYKIADVLGVSDLTGITNANLTGFSDLAFTVLTEEIEADKIRFDLYSSDSAKDIMSVDIYTGDASDFTADTSNFKNLLKRQTIAATRSHLNTVSVTVDDGLTANEWYYFKLLPRDDLGTGVLTQAISGYINPSPKTIATAYSKEYILNGTSNLSVEIAASSMVYGYKYKITDLGTSVNWSAMGASTSAGTAAVGIVFTRNSTAFSGTGGKVIQQSNDFYLDETHLSQINKFKPESESYIQLPTIQEGAIFILANHGKYNIFIKDGTETVATLRPDERIDIEKTQNGWYDPRGNILSI